MQDALTIVAAVILLVGLALAACIKSDSLERKRRLKRLRRDMCSLPDIPDDQFSATFSEIEASRVLEMRQLLGSLLGIDVRKIRSDWRFNEELKNMEAFIFMAFAQRYAPERLRNSRSFVFPARQVTTVHDLFLEAQRLESNDQASP